jgi:stage V sporulation protein B
MGVLLTKPEYGVLGVALSVFYITSVLTQNTFSWSATKFIAVKPENAMKYFRTSVLGNLVLALAVSSVLVYQTISSETYLTPVLIVCISLAFTAILNSYASLLRGFKTFNPIVVVNVLNPALKLVVAVMLVLTGFGVFGALSGVLFSVVFAVIYLAFYTRKIDLEKVSGWSFRIVLETIPISVIFLSVSFLVNGSVVILRFLTGSDVAAGSFNAALTIARAPFFISSALVTVIFPYVSSEEFREMLSFESLKYVILFVLPVCITMAADPKAWLILFFSTKYLEAESVLMLLSLAIGFISLVMVFSSNLIALGKYSFASVMLTVFSILYLVVSVATFNSPEGVAASLLIISVILGIFFLIYYRTRFYFKGSMQHVVKLFLCYFFLYLVMSAMDFNSRLFCLFQITASLLVYFLVISVLGLFDERDVEFLFSPFPDDMRNLAAGVVRKLNTLLR